MGRPKKPVEAIIDLPGEVWKPIFGYEGLYEVSNMGRIKSVARKTITGNRGCPAIIRGPNVMKGYHCVALQKDKKKKVYRIHRLVAEAFIGHQPSKEYQINHIDGDKGNNKVENLEWVTPRENSLHAIRTGLSHETEQSREKKRTATKKLWENPEYVAFQKRMAKDVWKRRKESGFTTWREWRQKEHEREAG